MTQRTRYRRFPYIWIRVQVRHITYEGEALLDTGFSGGVILPVERLRGAGAPDWSDRWTLADGRRVRTPSYNGTVELDGLHSIDTFITELGREAIIGVQVIRHFSVILDHGRRVIVEP